MSTRFGKGSGARRERLSDQRRRRTGRTAFIETLEGRWLLAAPVIDPIADTQVYVGKSLILPITASDADGNALSYQVSSDNPNVSVQLHTGNPFLRLSVANFGQIDIELLRDVAPNAVDIIAGLVQAGFYNGLTFHRVIPNFMIQGGDPAGDGTGGPGFQFDDEFNSDAVFTGNGQLAMAKAADDTNGSQFFITDSQPRWLDFQHTIFGQLVRGMDVVKAIEAVPRDSNDKPLTPVTITSAQLFNDTSDAVITLKATGNGPATITVTANDGTGSSDTKTFHVTTAADTTNDPPFLGPIADVLTPVDTPVNINVPVIDIDGGNNSISGGWVPGQSLPNVAGKFNGNILTLTPSNGITGIGRITLTVTDPSGQNSDSQVITVGVGDRPISGQSSPVQFVAGQAATFQVGAFTDSDPNGSAANFTATINWGDGQVTNTATITPLGNGTYSVSGTNTYAHNGTYPVLVSINGNLGATLKLNGIASETALSAGGSATLNEGDTFTRAGTLGIASAGWTMTADYGDGTGPQAVALAPDGSFNLSHTYVDTATAVTLVAQHASEMPVTQTLPVTVTNVAPTASSGGDSIGLAGNVMRLTFSATDPSTADTAAGFSYQIDWKDGSAVQAVSVGTTSATHVFAADGTYNVEVRAVDKDGGVSSPSVHTMDVVELNLGSAVSINEGGTLTRAGSLITPDSLPISDWTLTVDYGTGAGSQPLMLNNDRTFALGQTYDDNGGHIVTVAASDANAGISLNRTLAITVNNVAPTATSGGDTGGLRGDTLNLTFSATDPSPADLAAGFSYQIDWKDGSAVQNVLVGTNSAAHVFVAAGTYNVEVRAVDKEGAVGPASIHTMTVGIAAMEPDPLNPTLTALRVMGTPGNDQIRVLPVGKSAVKVMFGKASIGVFAPTGRIRIFGGDGNDSISVDPKIKLTAELHGGNGNDTLTGGGGNNILIGDGGADVLNGGTGRNLLIGGIGKDKLNAGSGDNILIGGQTALDSSGASLAAILAEWTRKLPYATRVKHLQGFAGGFNGSIFLSGGTVIQDTDADVLNGGSGSDWFLYGARDSVRGWKKGEYRTRG